MPFILIGIHIVLTLSLLPWISVAFWVANFLNDAVQAERVSDFIVIEVISHLLILSYPVFVAYGIISSWISFKKSQKPSTIILKSLSPIIVLFIGIILLFLPHFISGAIHTYVGLSNAP